MVKIEDSEKIEKASRVEADEKKNLNKFQERLNKA